MKTKFLTENLKEIYVNMVLLANNQEYFSEQREKKS